MWQRYQANYVRSIGQLCLNEGVRFLQTTLNLCVRKRLRQAHKEWQQHLLHEIGSLGVERTILHRVREKWVFFTEIEREFAAKERRWYQLTSIQSFSSCKNSS